MASLGYSKTLFVTTADITMHATGQEDGNTHNVCSVSVLTDCSRLSLPSEHKDPGSPLVAYTSLPTIGVEATLQPSGCNISGATYRWSYRPTNLSEITTNSITYINSAQFTTLPNAYYSGGKLFFTYFIKSA